MAPFFKKRYFVVFRFQAYNFKHNGYAYCFPASMGYTTILVVLLKAKLLI
jgi:hypothetical protein